MKKMKLKYPDGTNKARVQAAKGTATDKGRNQGGVPANSELGKKLKASDEAATKRLNAMSENDRKAAMNKTTSATTQATIDATGTAKSTNKKLETYTDKTAKTKEAAKKAEASKYDKSSALKSIKEKGAKKMNIKKK